MSDPVHPLVAFATEQRVRQTPDGAIWAPAGFGHDYWASLLGERLPTALVVRAEPVDAPPPGAERVDGRMVVVTPLPGLRVGPRLPVEVVTALARLWRAPLAPTHLLRLPGFVGSLLLPVTLLRRRRLAVQVVGDPIDVAFRAKVGGVAGKVAGVVLWASLRLACRRAAVCAYVTGAYLQRRYPAGPDAVSLAFSDVVLPPTGAPRHDRTVRRLVTVGSLEQPYKRVDLLVEALSALRSEGWDVDLDVVGDGRLRSALEAQAFGLGLDVHVRFHGEVAPARVQELLAGADVFALCSDAEGMPRALIEAMAAGLPCVGSAVGGIPELLPPESTFAPGSLPDLLAALRRPLGSPMFRAQASSDNRARAAAFSAEAVAVTKARFRDALLAPAPPTASP